MTERIRKDFLLNVKFSDSAAAWALQAQGYYYSAQATFKGNTIADGKKFMATNELYLYRFCYKNVCYSLSHSIELGLKALYCLHGGESVEKFSHKILDLIDDLTVNGILQKEEFDKDALEIASTLLDWEGRYHRPQKKKIQEKVGKLYTRSQGGDPEMLERKSSINFSTHKKLSDIAEKILAKVPVSPAYVGYLFHAF